MKLFAFLFSFYMLTLNFLPCADSTESVVKEEKNISAKPLQEHNNESDECSTFCTCDCCSSTSLHLQFEIAKLTALPFKPSKFRYPHLNFQSCDLQGVWQPPRAEIIS